MSKIYGFVISDVLYTNTSSIKVKGYPDGLYSMDMEVDDFVGTITPAEYYEAKEYLRKSSNIEIIYGIGYKDSIVPFNPIKYKLCPIKVHSPNYEDYDEICVAKVKNVLFFLEVRQTNITHVVSELKIKLIDVDGDYGKINIDNFTGFTPELKIAYSLNNISFLAAKREAEIKLMKERMKDKEYVIRDLFTTSGGIVNSITKNNRGFIVQWEYNRIRLNTWLNDDLGVIEAGFCVSNYDQTQSAASIVNLLKEYIEDGSHIHLTRY